MLPNRDNVAEMFDRIAPRYDLTNRILSLGLDLRWRKALAKHLPQQESISLLDLATGTGDQIAALLQKKASITKAIGIDFSEGMLKIARQKFQDEPIDFLHADALNLPFEEKSFDLCTFSFGIRNVKDPLKALQEMHRVSKIGGRALILEFSMPKGAFRMPYLFYLRHLLPLLGTLFAKDFSAYRYLNQTIEKFPSGPSFLSWMEQAGWKNLQITPLLFGAVSLYRGDRLA